MFNISNVAGAWRWAKKCRVIVIGNHPLSMGCRILFYSAGLVIGVLLLCLPLLLFPFLLGNEVLQSALVVFLLTFPLVTANWLIKNSDMSQQLKDSSQQLEYSLQQQNETLFSNSLQLLYEEKNIKANSAGLRGLVKLKQEGKIDPERIDFTTSSGLQIEGVNLQRVDLRGADLQGVNLQRADLQGADLRLTNFQGADLREANLQKANLQWARLQKTDLQGADIQEAKFEYSQYDNGTQFPDGFDPKKHKMILFQRQDKGESVTK